MTANSIFLAADRNVGVPHLELPLALASGTVGGARTLLSASRDSGSTGSTTANVTPEEPALRTGVSALPAEPVKPAA
jgi:hypothetical protein